jgi:hypothetical protein
MTPEQEANVFQDLGAIKTGIENLNHLLDAHTAQDMTQFTTMTDTVKEVHDKVDKLINQLSVDKALKDQHEQFVKKIASTRAVWVASGVTAFWSIFQTFGYALWQWATSGPKH